MTRPTDPNTTLVPPLDERGFVKVPATDMEGLLNELTPNGTPRIAVILSKMYDLLKEETDVAKDSMAARAARDRAAATAWDAATTLLKSYAAIPMMTVIVVALALGGLELVGVDIDKLPGLITAWRCQ